MPAATVEVAVEESTCRSLGSPSRSAELSFACPVVPPHGCRHEGIGSYVTLNQSRARREMAQNLGYLDEQFRQVEDLQDEASPNFVEEVVVLFFKDSAKLMSNLEQALEKYPRDFNRWDAYMQQLKGSCSSIGASRMKSECLSFRDNCGQGNVEGCMGSLQKLKREHAILRQKLESYFQLLRQAGPAGAATRPVM